MFGFFNFRRFLSYLSPCAGVQGKQTNKGKPSDKQRKNRNANLLVLLITVIDL